MTIVFAIVLIGILIVLHELGHFVAAKLSNVQVNEFSLFMGPAILKWQGKETLYSIRCIPFGGYCAMEGEDGESDNPRSFQRAAWWKRLIILVAGSAMNLLTGFVIYLALYMPIDMVAVPQLVEFTDCCTFHSEDGLQVGDELLEIDGRKVYLNQDISVLLGLNETGVHDIVVRRGNEVLTFEDLPMTHTHTDENGETYSHYGITYGKAVSLSVGERIGYCWNMVVDNVRMVGLSLEMLISGQAGVSDLTGPVGIVSQMNEVAQESETTKLALLNLLSMGAFIAINLGVMNLLPLPALDGGRVLGLLLTTTIEKIIGKKLDPKYEGFVHGVGMLLLILLMVFTLFKDIFTIFQG